MTTTNAPIPVFDGHNDVLLRIYRAQHDAGPAHDFFRRNDAGHLDLPRAKEGGFAGGFFAVFVPKPLPEQPPPADWNPATATLPPALEREYAQQIAMGMSALLFRLEEQAAGQLKVVRTASDLSGCIQSGTIAAILHFEGAEAMDPDFDALHVFYEAGLRSLGLVWSRPTIFAEGVPFRFPHSPDTGPGLTDVGKALVKECNRLGVMIDLSHLNEKGFWDVASTSHAPLVATHSNAHALCPSTRNLTDKQLDAIRESDGMVGVNFGTIFLREDGDKNSDTPIADIVRHIEYLVERLGIERVGLGSDFDGATIPDEMGDVTGLPRLFDALRARGYDDASLYRLGHENWVRVLGKTWKG
jgi:membrane dipeptidase